MFMVGLSPMFPKYLNIITLTPQAAISGILDSINNNSFYKNNKILINHILLIFKLCFDKSREKKFVNINR